MGRRTDGLVDPQGAEDGLTRSLIAAPTLLPAGVSLASLCSDSAFGTTMSGVRHAQRWLSGDIGLDCINGLLG